jgi:hypothetical protein
MYFCNCSFNGSIRQQYCVFIRINAKKHIRVFTTANIDVSSQITMSMRLEYSRSIIATFDVDF